MTFVEDKKAQRELENVTGKKILGVECPKRNRTGEICKECDRVAKLWRMGTADAEQEARGRQAKDSYFLNVQLRSGDLTALKIGKKVAKSLKTKLERYKDKTAAAFGYANIEDKGQWLAIHKTGEYPNFEYELEVLGESADPVDADKVKAMPSLTNITEDFNDGELSLQDISHLNSGDSLEFRMLPIPTGEGKATEMVFRFYHWRCSEADILGGEDVESVGETEVEAPKEFSEYMEAGVSPVDTDVTAETKQYTLDNPPDCFGFFDGTDDCLDKDCDLVREACAAKAGYKEVDGEFVKVKKKKA